MLDSSGVDGVAEVVPGSVFNMADQCARFAQRVEQFEGQFDVLQFAVAAEVVDLAGFPVSERDVDSSTMIEHVDPVSNVVAFSVDRQRFVFQRV